MQPTLGHVAQFFEILAGLHACINIGNIDIWIEQPSFWTCNAITKEQHMLATKWLEQCKHVHTVFSYATGMTQTKKNMIQAFDNHYDVIISLMPKNPIGCSKLARKINSDAYIIGFYAKTKIPFLALRLKKLNNRSHFILNTPEIVSHIKNHMKNVGSTAQNTPSISSASNLLLGSIPRAWISYAKLRFLKWEIEKKNNKFGHVVFLDLHSAKWKNRWNPKTILNLITFLKKQDPWGDTSFIVFCPAVKVRSFSRFFGIWKESKIFLCNPHVSVFQLPAIMHLCDVVISVHGTSDIIATLLNIPTITIYGNMLYTKNKISSHVRLTKNQADMFALIAAATTHALENLG